MNIMNITTLFVFAEYLCNGYESVYVLIVSIISILFGVSIIIAKNPIISILFLIGLFTTISVYLMLLGLYYIGLSYLLVYVGAVSILFIFILMLINVRVSELSSEVNNSIPLAILTVVSFSYIVSPILAYSVYMSDLLFSYLLSVSRYALTLIFPVVEHNGLKNNDKSYYETVYTKIANVTSKSWDSSIIESNHITTIGNVLYTNLFIYLIITSLILLLAMVGTIVITVKKKSSRQN